MSEAFINLEVPPELIKKYDQPGPRYTSYPTVPHWSEDIGPERYAAALHSGASRDQCSLYFHIPFCDSRCTYCGCEVVITTRKQVGSKYVDSLTQELTRVSGHLLEPPLVRQLHWGGGTPNWLLREDAARLMAETESRFRIAHDVERSVELDPRITSVSQLQFLSALGFDRLSFGVQDLDLKVQRAIGRESDFHHLSTLVHKARLVGFRSINLDLIYGLPYQTRQTFQETLDRIAELRPDRLALFSYAHVPWLKQHQKKIPTAALPSRAEKFALFLDSVRFLCATGYEFIGLDHFALPDDPLFLHRQDQQMHRNFQGYSTHAELDLLGFGASSISSVDGIYAQNLSHLAHYSRSVKSGLATRRGFELSPTDQLRRRIISQLMCDGALRPQLLGLEDPSNFWEHFRDERQRLEEFQKDGLLRFDRDELHLTTAGRLFVRNICMTFDEYLNDGDGRGPRYSQTI